MLASAAAAVHADRFIASLPDGFDSPVAERGATFSVGQRQLLSFARALAVGPDILVLDEATSNVDTETEVWIQEAVENLMSHRTSIVIAHRLSTIRDATCILLLHEGRLVAQGTHEELMASSTLYRRMCTRLAVGRSFAELESVDELIHAF